MPREAILAYTRLDDGAASAAVSRWGVGVEEKTLTCKDCTTEFVFTVRDQQFYAERGFENDPQRCRPCRTQRKASRSRSGPSRATFAATCARCAAQTTLPFEPRGDRPVYCRACYGTAAMPAAPATPATPAT
ncbi:MAG: hypothetical protein NVS2B3_15470 [Vulcanimicrobiaceae bacterium]